MKKVLLGAALLLLTKLSFSQDVKFGIRAGLNLPKLETEAQGISVKSQTATNFQIGGFAEFNFSNLSVQPGLSLTGKGGKYEFMDEESSINLMYLEVPVSVHYNFPVSFGKVFVGAGPYAAFAISGKAKSGDEKEDVEFGSGEEEMKGTDFGLNFGGGVKLTSGINLGLNYGLGLSDLSNDDSSNTKNRVFSILVGYSF